MRCRGAKWMNCSQPSSAARPRASSERARITNTTRAPTEIKCIGPANSCGAVPAPPTVPSVGLRVDLKVRRRRCGPDRVAMPDMRQQAQANREHRQPPPSTTHALACMHFRQPKGFLTYAGFHQQAPLPRIATAARRRTSAISGGAILRNVVAAAKAASCSFGKLMPSKATSGSQVNV